MPHFMIVLIYFKPFLALSMGLTLDVVYLKTDNFNEGGFT